MHWHQHNICRCDDQQNLKKENEIKKLFQIKQQKKKFKTPFII